MAASDLLLLLSPSQAPVAALVRRKKEGKEEKRAGLAGLAGTENEEGENEKIPFCPEIEGREIGQELAQEDWIGGKDDWRVILDVDLIRGPSLATIGGV